nr:site-specific integrase [Dyadobacter sp. NIV53]
MLDLLNYFKRKYAQDYAVKIVQFFRSIYTYAVSKGMVEKNPLTSIRLEKLGEYDTTHLTQDEVKRISNFNFYKLNLPAESLKVLDEERDALIFTCYTGLHHSDYKNGAFELIEYNGRTWISGYRVKSKGGRRDKPYSIPLHPLALAIVDKYGGIDKLPKRNNSKRNQILKNIAAYTNIKVNLTTKIARKTLADYCLNTLQMRQEVLASILGHVSTKFIKHYAKISNSSIDEAMQFDNLNSKLDDTENHK